MLPQFRNVTSTADITIHIVANVLGLQRARDRTHKSLHIGLNKPKLLLSSERLVLH